MIKQQSKYEVDFIDDFLKVNPDAHAERVAGSGRKQTAKCDVIVIRAGKPFMVEVKATKHKKFCFSGSQRIEMLGAASKCGAIPILAIRFKHRKWVVVNLLERNNWTVHHTEKTIWEMG